MRISDSWDGTVFRNDAGGKALKLTIRLGSKNGPPAGKIEFHPYSEILHVYDTLKDGYAIGRNSPPAVSRQYTATT